MPGYDVATLVEKSGKSAPLPDFPSRPLPICMSSGPNLGKSNFLDQLDEYIGDFALFDYGLNRSLA
jgi:hypothetical protein